MNTFFKAEILDQNSNLHTLDLEKVPVDVVPSWEGNAKQEIEKIARDSDKNFNFEENKESTPLIIVHFHHYAKTVSCLIQDSDWYKRKQDIFLKVGTFIVLLRSSDLYCCPFSQNGKKIDFSDKMLNYAKLQPSDYVGKNFSMLLWDYMTGNHKKMDSHIKDPQDAIAICAVLFSEVIRYPNMFFHNILMTQHFKPFNEFCDYHPMMKGGTCKCQGKTRDISQIENLQQGENIPEKVKKCEQETLIICIQKMREKKKCTPFELNKM